MTAVTLDDATEVGDGSLIARHPVSAFFVLTYAISWTIWLGLAATNTGIETGTGFALNLIATAGPTFAGFTLAAALGGGSLRRLLGGLSPSLVSPRWALVALVLPLAMIAIAITISVVAFGGVAPDLGPTSGVGIPFLAVLFGELVRVLFLGGPLQEELGWRGFALPRLQRTRSAWDAALFLGLVWGLWHVPLYFVPDTGQAAAVQDMGSLAFAIGAFVVWTMGLSVLFAWLFNQTGGSLLVVMLLHAAVNVGAFIPAAMGSTGMASTLYAVVTWVVAILVAWRFGRATLSRSRDDPQG
jgi:membrane protease YdiL (CAAX protease family)